ncbi:hypothetical protein JCM9279_001847 [Rhodotorula babjevae]
MLARSVTARTALQGLASSSTLPTSTIFRRASPAPAAAAWQLLYGRNYSPTPTAPSFDPRQPLAAGAGGPPPLSAPPPPPPGPPQPPKARSATSEFYRNLVPAMLHCLALGSIVYYALELAYMVLAREKQGDELRAKVERLEGQLADARAGKVDVQGETRAAQRSWWQLW